MKVNNDFFQLPIMEAFYTIQGEGYWQGHAAYFIRLGGCDVGCSWCDVKASWDASAHPRKSVSNLVSHALAHPARMVVITGGEPTMYDLHGLTSALQVAGLRTHIETSGAHPLTGQWDWLCLSPKRFKAPLEEYYAESDELKVVIHRKSDLVWAEEQAAKVEPDTLCYLQPEWDNRQKAMPWIVEYVKQHPRWRATLQTHKYLDVP